MLPQMAKAGDYATLGPLQADRHLLGGVARCNHLQEQLMLLRVPLPGTVLCHGSGLTLAWSKVTLDPERHAADFFHRRGRSIRDPICSAVTCRLGKRQCEPQKFFAVEFNFTECTTQDQRTGRGCLEGCFIDQLVFAAVQIHRKAG